MKEIEDKKTELLDCFVSYTYGLKMREGLWTLLQFLMSRKWSFISLLCSLDRGDMQALVFSSLVCLQPLDERVELLPTVEDVSPCELYNLDPGSIGGTLNNIVSDVKLF